MLLKSCSNCNRTYSDETLSFCLVDGSILSAPYDPQKTLKLNSSLPPTFDPTDIPPTQKVYSFDFNDLLQKKSKDDSKVKWYWYIFAIVLGIVITPLTVILSRWTLLGYLNSYGLAPLLIVFLLLSVTALTFGVVGIYFGYFIPQVKWKWSVWICSPIILYCLFVLIAEFSTYRRIRIWEELLLTLGFILSVFFITIAGTILGNVIRNSKTNEHL